ncbi:MAG TPA: GMC family oxidoreductase N-terminal domain-containing protein [Methanofastidiosum sp.]|jgi:choline dehydrogenase-like flavoprotein|nr:GMC family oxidoreductase N-terminal domain-containing protein [Methanofastidiosum sp.]HNU61967.1 GMC family oxidoreductase N-terminal domain-containing protein [Methanofastidiosum sp.]HOI77084.1 GMC family oxidoreductase N-terminal domain-containing protein [Methanofastidiosum sp.]
MDKYDYIIIGSGASGGAVAEKISSDHKVLILEKGEYLPLNEAHKGYFRASSCKDFEEHGKIEILSGNGVGGTTLLAIGNGVRTQEKELKKLGIDIEKELDEVERDFELSPIPENMLGDRTNLFIEKSKELGYDPKIMPKMIDFKKCKKCGKCNMGCQFQAKKTSLYYIEKAISKGAELKTNFEALRINKSIKYFKVQGVEKGNLINITAKNVILSTGALDTPKILNNSGIMTPKKLFVDIFVTIGGKSNQSFKDEINMAAYIPFNDFLISPYYSERITKMLSEKKIESKRDNIIGLMIKIKDDSFGYVDKNFIEKYCTGKDVQKISNGVAIASRILKKSGVDTIVSTEAIGAHPGGTAPIGITVDNQFKTRMGFYVCDASILPESPGAPPILSLMALGKKLGENILNST